MAEQSFSDILIPPFEKSPEIERMNKENRERCLTVPYTEISQFPDLINNFDKIIPQLNNKRKGYNLSPVQFPTSFIRLIHPDIYDKDNYFNQHTQGAFYSPDNDVVFIRFEEDEFTKFRLKKLKYIYTMTHELTHKDMDHSGIKEYSNILNEAITDFTTREILEGSIFPNYLNSIDYTNRERYLSEFPTYEGIPLIPEDIILAENGQIPTCYSRFPEMYLLRQIQFVRPDVHDKLFRHAFSGKPEDAKTTIIESFGKRISFMLNFPNTNFKELGDQISQYKDL